MNKKPLWAWKCKHSDLCLGPFDSRKEAVTDAEKSGREFDIGYAVYPEIADYITGDIDDILDLAVEAAWNAGICIDDRFELTGSRAEAQTALDVALEGWAREWIRMRIWAFKEEG